MVTQQACQHDDDDVSSDTDALVQRRRGMLRRVHKYDIDDEQEPLWNNFTIKDVKGSLPYFTGDDKLPIVN